MKGTRDHITVNACVLANSLVLLLHIIFAGAFPSGPYAREGPDGALYSISGNGYMDSTLFYVFMDQLFIPKTRHIAYQKLLILDDHGSHLDINTIQLCRANSIHLYSLLHHTTHVFQPLDVVIFHPVKSYFSRLTQHIKLATLGWNEPVNCCKTNFTKLLKEPWESMSTALIKTRFRKYGMPSIKTDSLKIKYTLLQQQPHHQAVHYLMEFQCQQLPAKINQMRDPKKKQ